MKKEFSGWIKYGDIFFKDKDIKSYYGDFVNYSYITIKFKDDIIYSYTINDNASYIIRNMIIFAQEGIGLNRYINLCKPVYKKGELNLIDQNDNINKNSLNIINIDYHSTAKSRIIKICYDETKTWVQLTLKNGEIRTYTVDTMGQDTILNIINLAIKGRGLKAYLVKNKIYSIEVKCQAAKLALITTNNNN